MRRIGSVHLQGTSGWIRLHPFRVSGRTVGSPPEGLVAVTTLRLDMAMVHHGFSPGARSLSLINIDREVDLWFPPLLLFSFTVHLYLPLLP